MVVSNFARQFVMSSFYYVIQGLKVMEVVAWNNVWPIRDV